MKYIKKFNESINQKGIIETEILDLLTDSFIDNGIEVKIHYTKTSLLPDSNPHKWDIQLTGYILERQSILIDIGSPETAKKSEYISLNDKIDDLKRLINWSKNEDIEFKNLIIFGTLNLNNPSGHRITTRRIDFPNIDSLQTYVQNNSETKYRFIQIEFENNGWQTLPFSNELIQEYKFEDMNKMTNFISQCMKIFENENHHPHYFYWKNDRLIISLKTHSTDSVTEKDWIVANKLDNLV